MTPTVMAEDSKKDVEKQIVNHAALEVITITSEKRPANLQETAISVAVRNGDDLKALGRNSFEDMMSDISGVEVGNASEPNTPGNGIVIRGVLPASTPTGVSSAATTALYVDGIYNGLGSTFDVDRIEVLRGPQGTLYGRSATGGVVSIKTKNPHYTNVSGDVNIEMGNYGLQNITAALNIPIIDEKLAVRISGKNYERDGFLSKEGGHSQNKNLRVKVGYKPTELVEIIVGATKNKQTSNSGGAAIDMDHTGNRNDFTVTQNDTIATIDYESDQVFANASIDLDFANVSYIASVKNYEKSGTVIIGGNAIVSTDSTPVDKLVTHELRLSNTTYSGLSWVFGAFTYNNEEEVSQLVRWFNSGGLVFDQSITRETSEKGIFGEVTFPVNDNLRITAGLRYDDTEVLTGVNYIHNANEFGVPFGDSAGLPEQTTSYTLTGNDGLSEYSEITYKLRAEYDLSENNLLYASVSTGTTPGDVQATVGAGNVPTGLAYAQQALTAYELGSKNQFNENLQINASGFFYDYSGYQSAFNISVTPAPQFIVATAPAQMLGFELESVYKITEDSQLSFSLAYIDAKFTDEKSAEPTARYGDYIANITPWTSNIAYHNYFEIAGNILHTQVSANYKSSHYTSTLNNTLADAGATYFAEVDSRIEVDLSTSLKLGEDGQYVITAYVRNLLDEVDPQGVEVTVYRSAPGAPAEDIPFSLAPTLTAPRTIGISASVSF